VDKLIRRLAASIFRPSQNQRFGSQFVRQILSGALATSVDLLVFHIGLAWSLSAQAAALISVFSGAVVNFLITRYYVFGHIQEQKKDILTQITFYIPAVLVSLGLTQLIIYVFHNQLGWNPMLVRAGAVPVVYLWTVLCGKFIIFNKAQSK
jgi:putative flippase GtrA